MLLGEIMSKHTEHSSFREKLIEHLLVGELLKLSWKKDDCGLEVAKPEVDNSGYDVVLEAHRAIRHVQLKASYIGGKTSRQKIQTKLMDKQSGCVIWVYFDENTLELGPFLFFGDSAGKPLPNIDNAKVAKHTKGDQYGNKAERPNIRELNKGQFMKIETIELLYDKLFKPEA